MREKYKQMTRRRARESEYAAETRLITRRSLLEKLGIVAAGAMFGARTLRTIDKAAGYAKWPPDNIEILPAYGSETIPKGGPEWVVFGGFGQKESTNAAQELFGAIRGEQVVSSVKYANQGFTIDDLAEEFEKLIIDRRMESLNLVGVSMGLPIALMTLRRVWERNELRGADKLELPTINYVTAYSSPADWQDAMDGDMVNLISTLSRQTRHEPAVVDKFLFSALDGDGDAMKAFNTANLPQFLRYLKDTIRQTFNHTPPRMALSQIWLMRDFNLEKEWVGLRHLLKPNRTKFIYCTPTNYIDRTVNNSSSIEKYSKQVTQFDIGASVTVLDTGEVGHANTAASAAVLGEFIYASAA